MPHHTKHSDKKFKLYNIFKISLTKKSEITKTVIAVAELFTNFRDECKRQFRLIARTYYTLRLVGLFVSPIITQKPLDRFASNFDW